MVNQQQQSNFQLRQTQVGDSTQGLHEPKKCRNCGHQTAPGADICEHCGVWQLVGQCCFCYAPVRQGQMYCGSCGNPPEGKPCPNCGTRSIFDFCPKCESPVSKGAPEFLDQVKNMPEVVEILQQMADIEAREAKNDPTAPTVPDWLSKLSNYEKQFDTKASVSTQHIEKASGFAFKSDNKDVSDSLNSMQSNKGTDALAAIEAQRAEIKKKIADLQNRAFSSNQQARAFSTSIAIALPRLRVTTTHGTSGNWICNFAGVLHSGPSDCECPSMGGHWVGGEPPQTIISTEYTNI